MSDLLKALGGAVAGIAVGLGIDFLFKKIIQHAGIPQETAMTSKGSTGGSGRSNVITFTTSQKITLIIIIIIQILITICIVYGLALLYSTQLSNGGTAGLFFAGFLFGVQFNMYTNISLITK